MLNDIYLLTKPESDVRDLKTFSPHVQVRELPSFEDDNIQNPTDILRTRLYLPPRRKPVQPVCERRLCTG